MEKKRLGRGLDALISGGDGDTQTEVALERIQHNPFQPRKHFGEEQLGELAASIKAQGLIQPIVVRSVGAARQYSPALTFSTC